VVVIEVVVVVVVAAAAAAAAVTVSVFEQLNFVYFVVDVFLIYFGLTVDVRHSLAGPKSSGIT